MRWPAKFFTREAEQRQAIAEDRAAFLERELSWMRGRVEAADLEKDRAVKMLANVFGQLHYAFMPYPEVNGLPPRPETPQETLDAFQAVPRPRDEAMSAFEQSELGRFADIWKR